MVKIVYFPAYFKLRRRGALRAELLSTLLVIVATWFLHAYQFFWLERAIPGDGQRFSLLDDPGSGNVGECLGREQAQKATEQGWMGRPTTERPANRGNFLLYCAALVDVERAEPARLALFPAQWHGLLMQ